MYICQSINPRRVNFLLQICKFFMLLKKIVFHFFITEPPMDPDDLVSIFGYLISFLLLEIFILFIHCLFETFDFVSNIIVFFLHY